MSNDAQVSAGSINFVGQVLHSVSTNIHGGSVTSIQGLHDFPNADGGSAGLFPYNATAIGASLNPSSWSKAGTLSSAYRTLLGGIVAYSYFYDFYFRIHSSAYLLNFGNIIGTQTVNVYLWNAFFNTVDITSISAVNTTDVTISTSFTTPSTFTSMQSSTVTIGVTPTGSPNLAGTYIFNFVGAPLSIYLLGKRVIVFPFPPKVTFGESRSWATDVISARSGETRYSLRDTPRLNLRYDYEFHSREDHSQAVTMANTLAAYSVGLPLWSDNYKLASVTAGSTDIYFKTANLEFVVGSSAVIYTSFSKYEVVQIAAIYSDHVTLSNTVVASQGACWIIPIVIGYLSNGFLFSDTSKHANTASLEATIVENFVSPVWVAPTYLGYPILTDTQVVSLELSGGFRREQSVADCTSGYIQNVDQEYYNRYSYTISFIAKTRAELYSLRRKFDYIKGKYTPFFLPSGVKDIDTIWTLSAGTSTLTIYREFWDLYPPQYVRVSNTSYADMFTVSSVVVIDATTAYLQFTTNAVNTISNITKIEIVRLVRLDSDTVTFTHEDRNVTTVKVAVIGVIA
jgi:hypothetical protein